MASAPRKTQPIELPPYYRIVGPDAVLAPGGPTSLVLAPGKGFGDGKHETTQLCLLGLGYLLRNAVKPKRMLDFGAGNGVLAIAAAIAGADVEAVEIDEGARAEARVNAALNHVSHRIAVLHAMSEPPGSFEIIAANILRDVLLAYAEALSARLAQAGYLLLSGLTSTDVPSVLACYRPLLGGHHAEIYERGSWRAVLFVPLRGPRLE